MSENVTDTESTAIDNAPKRRGAPVLPASKKRTAKYPLRFAMSDYERHEQYCEEHGLKMAEFYRMASKEYIASGEHDTPSEPSTNDKVYILNMTSAEKQACDDFAAEQGISLADFFRAAAERYMEKHS